VVTVVVTNVKVFPDCVVLVFEAVFEFTVEFTVPKVTVVEGPGSVGPVVITVLGGKFVVAVLGPTTVEFEVTVAWLSTFTSETIVTSAPSPKCVDRNSVVPPTSTAWLGDSVGRPSDGPCTLSCVDAFRPSARGPTHIYLNT